MRYFIKFSYNGENYHGWQVQPNAVSVQQTLSDALAVMLGFPVEIMGAGRTDAGVHAREMYAHFDFGNELPLRQLAHKLNSYLPADIAIHDIIQVNHDAHVRFDAVQRTYEYHINTSKDPFLDRLSWYYRNALDVERMNQAAALLFNHSDFQCFSKSNTDVATYLCRIDEAQWTHSQNRLVFTISADRFLRNMVRAIVGTLVNVGIHKISLQDFENIIISKDRRQAGFSVPAHGLYLTRIKYPYLADTSAHIQ